MFYTVRWTWKKKRRYLNYARKKMTAELYVSLGAGKCEDAYVKMKEFLLMK